MVHCKHSYEAGMWVSATVTKPARGTRILRGARAHPFPPPGYSPRMDFLTRPSLRFDLLSQNVFCSRNYAIQSFTWIDLCYKRSEDFFSDKWKRPDILRCVFTVLLMSIVITLSNADFMTSSSPLSDIRCQMLSTKLDGYASPSRGMKCKNGWTRAPSTVVSVLYLRVIQCV